MTQHLGSRSAQCKWGSGTDGNVHVKWHAGHAAVMDVDHGLDAYGAIAVITSLHVLLLLLLLLSCSQLLLRQELRRRVRHCSSAYWHCVSISNNQKPVLFFHIYLVAHACSEVVTRRFGGLLDGLSLVIKGSSPG
jgi:hypothetical protein